MKKWNLEGKKALVTGGSKGIGKAIVAELLELGAEVLFTARDAEGIANVERQFKEKGVPVHGLRAEVSSNADRERIVNWIAQKWGKLDILVNNVGINIRKASNDYTSEEFRRVLEIDLFSPFELSRKFFPLLGKSGCASIVNVASVAGIMDAQTGAPYGMAKSGTIQLTRNLACEWASNNIRVNTVSPWFTETRATSGMLTNPEKLNHIIARTPARRIAKNEEIAAAVAFLAMNKASFITGQNIVVDGGATSSIL
jgi:Tropinone reductase 1